MTGQGVPVESTTSAFKISSSYSGLPSSPSGSLYFNPSSFRLSSSSKRVSSYPTSSSSYISSSVSSQFQQYLHTSLRSSSSKSSSVSSITSSSISKPSLQDHFQALIHQLQIIVNLLEHHI